MATVNFFIKGKKAPAEIRIRFVNGRGNDWELGLNQFVKHPDNWNKAEQKVIQKSKKFVLSEPDADKTNRALQRLKVDVLDQLNIDFREGEIIDKLWLEKTIAKIWKRPTNELKKISDPTKVYLSDWYDAWIENKLPRLKNKNGEYIADDSKKWYHTLRKHIEKFEETKEKIRFKGINGDFMENFAIFLKNEKFAQATVDKALAVLRTVIARAENDNIIIDKSYKGIVTGGQRSTAKKFVHPYFNISEIEKIFKHDFSDNKELDQIRDLLIIGLCTGLRVSDLTSLEKFTISKHYIEGKNQKTGADVAVPIHPMVRSILNKKGGVLPDDVTTSKFNKEIKKIAKILKFDEMMLGGVSQKIVGTKMTRQVIKMYHKHELITTHICRRSFATNNRGLIPDKDLMNILGWTNEKQLARYDKKSAYESGSQLMVVWQKQYEEMEILKGA